MQVKVDANKGEITITLSGDEDGDAINRHYKQGLSLEINPYEYYELLVYQGLSQKTIETYHAARRKHQKGSWSDLIVWKTESGI